MVVCSSAVHTGRRKALKAHGEGLVSKRRVRLTLCITATPPAHGPSISRKTWIRPTNCSSRNDSPLPNVLAKSTTGGSARKRAREGAHRFSGETACKSARDCASAGARLPHPPKCLQKPGVLHLWAFKSRLFGKNHCVAPGLAVRSCKHLQWLAVALRTQCVRSTTSGTHSTSITLCHAHRVLRETPRPDTLRRHFGTCDIVEAVLPTERGGGFARGIMALPLRSP